MGPTACVWPWTPPPPGGKVLCTVWLDGGGAPLYAEFTQDSRVVLTARLLSFTSE